MNEFVEFGKLLNIFFLGKNWKGNEIDQINKVKRAFSVMENAAQQRLHLTAIAACGLGVLVGLGVGWFIFAG